MSFRRVLGGELSALPEVRQEVRAHLAGRGVPEQALYAVDLVLEELAGNALRYGGIEKGGSEGESGGEVVIDVALEGDHVRVTLTDDGRPFDPTRQPPAEIPESIEEARIGGLGIPMVRAVVSAMRYRREAGRNRLELDVPYAHFRSSARRA